MARYLKRHGYRIIPVNPGEYRILGQHCYPGLVSIGEPVDVVDVFRRSDEVLAVADEAIFAGARAVWLQERGVNEEATDRARRAGLLVVMDRCILKEHMKLRRHA